MTVRKLVLRKRNSQWTVGMRDNQVTLEHIMKILKTLSDEVQSLRTMCVNNIQKTQFRSIGTQTETMQKSHISLDQPLIYNHLKIDRNTNLPYHNPKIVNDRPQIYTNYPKKYYNSDLRYNNLNPVINYHDGASFKDLVEMGLRNTTKNISIIVPSDHDIKNGTYLAKVLLDTKFSDDVDPSNLYIHPVDIKKSRHYYTTNIKFQNEKLLQACEKKNTNFIQPPPDPPNTLPSMVKETRTSTIPPPIDYFLGQKKYSISPTSRRNPKMQTESHIEQKSQ